MENYFLIFSLSKSLVYTLKKSKMVFISKIVNVQPYLPFEFIDKKNWQKMYQVFPHVFHSKDLNFELIFLSTHDDLFCVSNEVAVVKRNFFLSITKFVLLSNLCSSMHSCSCFLWKGFPFFPCFLLIFFVLSNRWNKVCILHQWENEDWEWVGWLLAL